MHCMAMGRRKRDRRVAMWITTTELPTAASHPFYRRVTSRGFDSASQPGTPPRPWTGAYNPQ